MLGHSNSSPTQLFITHLEAPCARKHPMPGEYKREYLIRSKHLLFIMWFLHLKSFGSLQLFTIPVQTQIEQQIEEL